MIRANRVRPVRPETPETTANRRPRRQRPTRWRRIGSLDSRRVFGVYLLDSGISLGGNLGGRCLPAAFSLLRRLVDGRGRRDPSGQFPFLRAHHRRRRRLAARRSSPRPFCKPPTKECLPCGAPVPFSERRRSAK